jgi:phosphoserine phosphatase RsbU/P
MAAAVVAAVAIERPARPQRRSDPLHVSRPRCNLRPPAPQQSAMPDPYIPPVIAPAPAEKAPSLAAAAWPERLAAIESTMREMSRQSEPSAMVATYGARMREFYQYDGIVSISRRGMPAPTFRITRSSTWTKSLDPWKDKDKQPVLTGGLLGQLLYGDKPVFINDFRPDPSDPGYEFIKDARSLIAIPHYDGGIGLNMVVTYRRQPHAIDPEKFPELVWLSNLFGRATGNLALARELREVNAELDREARVIADIQRSLLPERLPMVPGLSLAASYQTSKNAGGDYYDFFELEGGKLGLLIADVSGHGTPAAVLMAILHAIAHLHAGSPGKPEQFLSFINRQLCQRYTRDSGTFVTAFYAIYDPADRSLVYSSAGHNPPRLRVGFTGDQGPILALDQAQGLPMGVLEDAEYHTARVRLDPGDALVLYTDGITEARGPLGTMFDTERLDAVIGQPHRSAPAFLNAILASVQAFAAGEPTGDDRTVLVAAAE